MAAAISTPSVDQTGDRVVQTERIGLIPLDTSDRATAGRTISNAVLDGTR